MNVLILHAHPEPKSFTSAMKDVAIKHFTERGDNLIVNDLYAMNFNPVGVQNDFKKISDPEFFSYLKEQMVAFKTDGYVDELKAEMDKLLWADLIILNFPLWWSSMPAIMKGWFDRVLAFGFAYHPGESKFKTGKFLGKKAMCAITTGGTPESYGPDGENGELSSVIYHINHGTFSYCGMTVLPYFVGWRAHLKPREVLEQYLIDYKQHLENLDAMEPLY
jgi:NAD(P)H dehydrogenase (quinone)